MKGRPKGGSKSAARASAAPPPKLKRVPPIIELMDHPELLRPWFKDTRTWRAWRALLKALFALPMTEEELALYRQCTGRSEPPSEAFLEASLIIGRRGGKSFVMALVAVYLAVFRDYSTFVVPGERLVLPVLASDKKQAKSVWKYAHAMLSQVEVLRPYLVADGDGLLELSNGVAIEIYAASFRSVRGVTIVSAILDEVAFFRSDEDSANPDREIVDAITPGMATIPGALLLLASSPYARRGVLYENFQRHYGRDGAPVLVWKAPSLVMHPSERLRKIVEAAYERDPASAAAEYGAEFRSDLEAFVTEEVITSVTVPGRYELPPMPHGATYYGFVDPAGGSGGDSFCIAIAHYDRKSGRTVLDAVRETKPPFSPESAVEGYAELLRSYRIHKVTGDHWGGEFVREPFRKKGIMYELSEQPKSDIYRDTLPLFNSGRVELLDLPRLANQFIGLERRTSRSGKDSIDHAPGGRDDLCNAAAGALLLASTKKNTWVSAELVAITARHPHQYEMNSAFGRLLSAPRRTQ